MIIADITTASTQSQTVQGNRRVVLVEVSSAGGTTSDTVRIHYLTRITGWYGAQYRNSTAAQFNNFPALFLGSTVNLINVVRSSLSTAEAFSFFCEGTGG